MTREEAINRLKTDIYQYTDFSGNSNENEFWEAFDMAIQALEQEPCVVTVKEDDAVTVKALDVENNKVISYRCVSCPKCGKWIIVNHYHKFCQYCGVSLRWNLESEG